MRAYQGRPARILLLLGCVAAACAVASIPPALSRTLAAAGCSVARPSLTADGEEQSMLNLINSYRARNGEPALASIASLERSAIWKSTDMAANHYFSHDDLNRGWQQRLTDCGYGPVSDGENIAEGYADASETFEQWRTSPPHNRNLLDPDFRAVGIGRAQSPSGDWYWTADFGETVDSASPAAATGARPSSPSSAGIGPNSISVAGATVAATAGSLASWTLPTLAAAQVALGATVLSSTPGDCLKAHTTPSLSAPAPECIPDGTSLFLVDGPATADGHTWWYAFGAGWVASDYLRPAS